MLTLIKKANCDKSSAKATLKIKINKNEYKKKNFIFKISVGSYKTTLKSSSKPYFKIIYNVKNKASVKIEICDEHGKTIKTKSIKFNIWYPEITIRYKGNTKFLIITSGEW